MKFKPTTAFTLLLVASLATGAHAQSEKTREQVKSELAEAIRTGDVVASGETGLKLNELYPQRYPAKTMTAGKTRAQVTAELAEAIRTGDVLANGDGGLKLNEVFPQRYPATTVASGKTREQVKAELAEAIRTGDVVASGETGLKLNELFPQRYAAKALAAGKTQYVEDRGRDVGEAQRQMSKNSSADAAPR
jgi:hypothetical protein